MVVEIRLYKRYDIDLVSLSEKGYPVPAMIRDAIVAYAHGEPLFFCVDTNVPFDMANKKTIHTRFVIPDTDDKTCHLMKNIKYGLRNNFCKMVLRNSLVQQNLNGYFTDESLISLHQANLGHKSIGTLSNVIYCSQLSGLTRQVEFAGRVITKDYQPNTISQPVTAQSIPVPTEAPSDLMFNQQTKPKESQAFSPSSDNDETDFMSMFDLL